MTALPRGSTLGIFGGGQLGRLIAQAAKGLGYRTAALDSSASAPALQLVDVPVVGPLDSLDSARRLEAASDLLTFEWELIPEGILKSLEKPLHPAASVLGFIQDRLVQRRFLAERGFPQTEFGEPDAPETLPFPVIVKRRRAGYDGKGQARLESAAELPKAAEVLKAPCIWERFVRFEKEISVILGRDDSGDVRFFPVAENLHRGGILHATRAPAEVSSETAEKARMLASEIAAALGHVGVLAVEMFLLPGGRLLVNEIAPRVHNSGHYTLGGCDVSQFEQHVRAVCGLPLVEPKSKGPAVMVNLLGDVWQRGEPRWETLKGVPGLELHLYGKSEARPGRKMAHYTVVGASAADEWARADERLAALKR